MPEPMSYDEVLAAYHDALLVISILTDRLGGEVTLTDKEMLEGDRNRLTAYKVEETHSFKLQTR